MKNSPKYLLQQLMVFTCTTSFIISVIMIFQNIIVSELEAITMFNWFIYAYTFFSGIIFIINFRLFVNVNTKIGFHSRFLIIYLVITIAIAYFLGPENVCYILIPITIIHYFLEKSVNEIFVYYEWFEQSKDNKDGKQLIEHLFVNNLPALEFAEKIKIGRNLLSVLSAIELALIIAQNAIKYKLSIAFYFCAIILYFSVFIILMMIGMFGKESYYSFLGFAELTKNQKRLYKVVCLIFGISLLMAILLSSNNALIKIPKFTERLQNAPSVTYTQNVIETPVYEEGTLGFLEQITENTKPGILAAILNIVYKIVKYGMILFAGFAFIFFMLRPIISGSLKEFMKNNPFNKLFQRLIDELKSLFQIVFKKDEKDVYSTVGARKFNDFIKDVVKKSRKSKEKKLEIDRLTKSFMSLINWGSKKEILYTNNLAPAEYTDMMEKYFAKSDNQDYCKYAHSAGIIYESALYGKDLISKEEEKCFNEAVDSILAYGKEK